MSDGGSAGSRGRLRIYLGAAPGVGKTYAMLSEAHRRVERGTDVVVGLIETHGRAHTAAMIGDLEVVPRRVMDYRGTRFEEMDLEAVLARRPAVALVDELAHTNVPGAKNEKRWQDIEDLLDAGIDVISTVNIQHLESLNDVVERITGVRQRETAPDAVVRAADQIELVDMSPESLRRRLAHGNVYAAEKVDAALGNYFRVGNLSALRELALLWVADRVEEGLEKYRSDHDIHATWAARTRIVVALTGGPEGETLLRRGAVIAGRSAGRDLTAVHVIRGDGAISARPDSLSRLRQLTEDLGGTFHTVVGEDIAAAVLAFARSVNGTQIVIGSPHRGRFSTAVRPSTAGNIVRDSGDIDVHVVTHEEAGGKRRRSRQIAEPRRKLIEWSGGLVLPLVVTTLLVPFRNSFSLPTIFLIYLLEVVAASLFGGLMLAIVASIETSLLVNFYFVPPIGTLTIAQPANVFAILVFVIVAAVIATIVDRSTRRANEATRRGAEATALASLSVGIMQRSDGVKALLDQTRETFGVRAVALFERDADRPRTSVVEVAGEAPPTRIDQADVTVDAGPGLTLALSGGRVAVADRRILEAFAAQAAALLERNRLATRAADAARLKDSERVRTALLAAVSHDLRTPLAGIKAAITTLRDDDLHIDEVDREALLADAAESVLRLDSLVANLLDLSRLQTGTVKPRLEPTSLDEVLQRALRGVPDNLISDETDDQFPLLYTDGGLLERSVANLVENALRFAPVDEQVRICAAVVPGGVMQLRIIDRGPGVAQSDQVRMFQPFQRLGDVPAGSGVGLGLAVARGLAEAVGAEVESEDTPGGGLTMVVTVPLADAGVSDPLGSHDSISPEVT